MMKKIKLLKNNWTTTLTVVWVIAGFVLVFIYLGIYKGVNWGVLTGFATWILAAGVFFAALQVIEAKKSTNAQIAMQLFREIRDEGVIEKMRSIYELKSDDLKYLPSRKKNDIDYVLDRLDTLGNLVNKGIIDRELAIETYAGPPSIRFWYKLEDYIRIEQKRRGYYVENFENFVRLSLDYFKEHGIEVKFYIKGEEDRGIDLINELQSPKLFPRSLEEIERDRAQNK